MGPSSKRGSPVAGAIRMLRASPESITAVTPGIVREVSATFVERMILRRPKSPSTRSCASAGRSP